MTGTLMFGGSNSLMATCSEDGHAPWVECGRGKSWTKKNRLSGGKTVPHLWCGGGGVCGFFVRALIEWRPSSLAVPGQLLCLSAAAPVLLGCAAPP